MLFAGLTGLGCGGDEAECGPPAGLVSAGVSAQVDAVEIVYGDFTSSPNNDCPPAEGGPTSLTIEGLQREPATDGRFSVVFCVPRPDEIGSEPVAIDDLRLLDLSDVNAELDERCTLRRDYDQAPSGTVEFVGYCDAGLNQAGYVLTLAATVPGVERCTDDNGDRVETPVSITLSGSAEVEAISF